MARICVIRQGGYPEDTRVRREVEALLEAGHEVDVFSEADDDEPIRERSGRLTVRRTRLVFGGRGSTLDYLLRYASFFLVAAIIVSLLHLRRRYDVVQVNSMPDALVFAALVPKLFGARVVLDLHECMPEFFSTRNKISPSRPMVRLIAWVEQASIRFADQVLTCTEQMRQAFISRGAPPEKITVVLNGADESIFNPDAYPPNVDEQRDDFVLISHGTIEERYGLDTIIRAVALLKDDLPNLRVEIYGRGSISDDLRVLCRALDVQDRVWISETFVPLDELLTALASADAGVVAMKQDAFRDLTLCNKMYELISMRKPAIVSRTRSVVEYYDESCFVMFNSNDEVDLARAIRELHDDPELGEQRVRRASEVNEPYRWPHQKNVYLRVINRALGMQVDPVEAEDALERRYVA